MFEKKKNIHFIGIGGIGMSAIASILSEKGFKISGSDLSKNFITEKLKKKKIKVFANHSKNNLKDVDIIVHSSAIKPDNEELKFARKMKIPIYSRAMILADVMRLKSSITVSGSHGKTTTTSLISTILESSNFDPTIINGGIINGLNINAKLGKGQWIIAEADESDGTFMFLPSTIGIINNIDLEHLDFYKDLNHIKSSFIRYAKNIPFFGMLFLCVDDKNVREIRKKLNEKKIISYGLSSEANFSAINIKTFIKKNYFFTGFDLVERFNKKKVIKNFSIPLIGKHNVQNCLASISLSKYLNISYNQIKASLKKFQGVKRRFSVILNNGKNLIIDDYAHHPSEIKVTLESLKLISKKRIIAIMEPHRYSRLSLLIKDFVKSLQYANSIYILPIHTAGETNTNEINNELFCKKLKKSYPYKQVHRVKSQERFFEKLREEIHSGDNIIFLGAGKSSIIANEFRRYLEL